MPIAVNHQNGEVRFLTDEGQWEKAQTAVNPQTKEMMAFDGKGWTAVPAQSKGVLNYVDDAVRSLASGATFGYADEIAAKADQLTGRGGTYEENLAKEKVRDATISPWIKIPGEIAGAVGSAVAAGPILAPIAAASGIARLPGIVRAIGGGAAGGAAFGSGNAEPGERLSGAATGAGVGAVLGPVAYGAAKTIGKGYEAVKGAFTPQANVTADLQRALQRDETTPQQFVQRYGEAQQTRPGVAIPADVGGENVRGLVERVAQTPGAGRTTVVPALTGRQQGQLSRISGDLGQLTGTRQSAAQAVEDTMAQRSMDAKPLYDAAFNFNAREAPEIARVWDQETSTGFGRSFLLKPEFRKTLQTEYGIRDPADAPLMVQIDAWKKVADDFITQNIGTNKARVVQSMRARVLDAVDKTNPQYAEARNAWAGPSRYLDAIEEGRNIFSTKVSGEELANALRGMSDAEKEGFRIGAVSAVRARMGNDPAKLGDMTKYLRSPEMREKIAAIMPTPDSAAQWERRLNFEIGSSELTGRSLGNSATARRLAEQKDSESIVGDLVMDAFMGHPPVSLLRRTVGAVPGKLRDSLRSKSDNILAELLTDPQSMDGLVRAMQRVEQQNARPSALRLPTTAVTNPANAIGEEPTARQFR